MRFHCGVSFSWRTIKKFLIPILLGILAYFGFNFIFDNTTPLGFINVNALDDYNVIDDSNSNNSIEDNFNYWSNVMDYDNSLDSNVVHKPLHDKIYWFDDNTTEIGVLSSIYILLFLYCLTMIIFRILTFIKGVKW